MGNNEKNNCEEQWKQCGSERDIQVVTDKGLIHRRQGVIDIVGISPNGFVLPFCHSANSASNLSSPSPSRPHAASTSLR
jgi:hypothetical protein